MRLLTRLKHFAHRCRHYLIWVDEDSAERVDDTDSDGFKEGVYYFGGEDDGAMTTGWLQLDITYDEATNDDYKYTAAAFNDDEDQTRWFYFKSNGKKRIWKHVCRQFWKHWKSKKVTVEAEERAEAGTDT